MTRGKAKPTEADESDFGTPEARRQASWVIEQLNPNDRRSKRIRMEDNIEWYIKRHYLTQPHADALLRYRDDAYLAGVFPPCIGNYDQRVTGGKSEISDVRLASKARRDHAIALLAKINKRAVALIEAVAVDGKHAGPYFQSSGMGTPNEALILLVRCCEALGKHYGLIK
jgi:hypothetical protein